MPCMRCQSAICHGHALHILQMCTDTYIPCMHTWGRHYATTASVIILLLQSARSTGHPQVQHRSSTGAAQAIHRCSYMIRPCTSICTRPCILRAVLLWPQTLHVIMAGRKCACTNHECITWVHIGHPHHCGTVTYTCPIPLTCTMASPHTLPALPLAAHACSNACMQPCACTV